MDLHARHIHLYTWPTQNPPLPNSSLAHSIDGANQRQKIFGTKVSPSLGNRNERIFRFNTGIAGEDGLQITQCIVEIDTIFAPVPASINQLEFLLVERMKRMSYTKYLWLRILCQFHKICKCKLVKNSTLETNHWDRPYTTCWKPGLLPSLTDMPDNRQSWHCFALGTDQQCNSDKQLSVRSILSRPNKICTWQRPFLDAGIFQEHKLCNWWTPC